MLSLPSSQSVKHLTVCPRQGATHGEPVRFLLVGAGPHARRTYIPHLHEFQAKGLAVLRALVELDAKADFVRDHQRTACPETELHFVPAFKSVMPAAVEAGLNALVQRLGISVVIISTEPLVHKVYGLWAISQGLNIIMDKPVTSQVNSCTSAEAASAISHDFHDLLDAYRRLQQRRSTFFLIHSHRRYHPGIHRALEEIRKVQEATGCPVTNIISTHCDGMWRMPAEIVDQQYHTFSKGYGKLSHSGYHFFDCCYQFLKHGRSVEKRIDRIEVVSSFLLPNGFLTALTPEDYHNLFGDDYQKACKYSEGDLRERMALMGELDANIQVTCYCRGDVIALAQINLQHNGFSRRSWLKAGPDLYKGIGRVRHEAHEIRSGPMQTICIDSRQANHIHDKSKPSTTLVGSDNHYDLRVFRNNGILGGTESLQTWTADDLDQQYHQGRTGLYGENIKRGILVEAIECVKGKLDVEDLASQITDHSVPVHLMVAAYISHVRRTAGSDPTVSLDIFYQGKIASPFPFNAMHITERSTSREW